MTLSSILNLSRNNSMYYNWHAIALITGTAKFTSDTIYECCDLVTLHAWSLLFTILPPGKRGLI